MVSPTLIFECQFHNHNTLCDKNDKLFLEGHDIRSNEFTLYVLCRRRHKGIHLQLLIRKIVQAGSNRADRAR